MDLLIVKHFHYPFAMLSFPQFCLLFADLLQAVGTTLNVNWLQFGKVEVGPICDAQGNQSFGFPMDLSLIMSIGILVSVGEAVVALTSFVSMGSVSFLKIQYR